MKTLFFTSALLTLILAITGCGGVGDSETEAPVEPASEPSGAKVVKITGNDQMRYDITEIKAKAGEAVRVELTNIGKMPAAAMSHNWVLLNRSVTEEEFTAFALASSQNAPSYIAPDSDLVLAKTKTLGPGESDSVEFEAPAEPGVYEFLCTFPGHFALMRGKLIVE
mgnify:CR=1 FL=1